MCGQVRVRISLAPIMIAACHCSGCQKLSASAFSLTALIPSAGFEVIKGEPVLGALHGPSGYFYCPNCLNWLFTRPAGMAFVNVRPTLFEVAAWTTPYIETGVSEKLAWATTAAIHSFERYPEASDFGPLMQDYATRAHPQAHPRAKP